MKQLVKTQKGKLFKYDVVDESGSIVSTRTSKRDYVACTSNGEFYFGRLDLVGKGDHGRAICALKAPTDYKEEYGQYIENCPTPKYFEEFIQEKRKYRAERLAMMQDIAYLKQ